MVSSHVNQKTHYLHTDITSRRNSLPLIRPSYLWTAERFRFYPWTNWRTRDTRETRQIQILSENMCYSVTRRRPSHSDLRICGTVQDVIVQLFTLLNIVPNRESNNEQTHRTKSDRYSTYLHQTWKEASGIRRHITGALQVRPWCRVPLARTPHLWNKRLHLSWILRKKSMRK